MGDKFSSQKALIAEKHLLLLLHDVPEPGIPERKGDLFWRDPNGHWKATKQGDGLEVLKNHFQRYEKRIDVLEEEIDLADQAKDYFVVIKRANPLVRAVTNMASALQAARDGFPRTRELVLLRDRAHDLQRSAELLLADAKSSLDFAMAEEVETQSQTGQHIAQASHRLNLIMALFLPLTAIGSVFGMNLESGLNPANTLYFWLALVLGLAVGYLVRVSIEKFPACKSE